VGGGVPEQWNGADETLYTGRLFDRDPPPEFPRCTRINFDLQFETGVQWQEIIPDPTAYPGETWYQTTVVYYFDIDILLTPNDPEVTQYHPATGSQVQFTVRNIGTDTAPAWRLIEFRDLSSSI
jgi:hypothetical protein